MSVCGGCIFLSAVLANLSMRIMFPRDFSLLIFMGFTGFNIYVCKLLPLITSTFTEVQNAFSFKPKNSWFSLDVYFAPNKGLRGF